MENKKPENKSVINKMNIFIIITGVLLLIMLAVVVAGAAGMGSKNSSSSAASFTSVGSMADTTGTGSEKSGSGTVPSKKAPASSGDVSGSDYALTDSSQGSSSVKSSVSSSVQPAPQSVPDSSSGSDEKSKPSADDFSGSSISKQEFSSLQIGMTYDEVVQAVGGNGSLTSDAGNTKVYEWPGYGSGWASVRLTFKSGKLYKKYQFGL